ncbi:MAG TPA: ABC transporter permease [Candidatus Limnocylindria bacterium]|nr:ABC transporter permease [Candidatus Limnocylindria bacterium]
MLGRRGTFWLLYLPPAAWLLVFFVVPLAFMALTSLRADPRGALFDLGAPSLANYERILATGSYLRLLGISVLMALGVALVATLLAYPVAYFLAFRAGRRATLFLVLLLIPFWTSYLLRVMAWKLMLGSEGAVNSFLGWTGVIDEPLSILLYNRAAVLVTLVYVWIPFAVLPIYAAMQRIDRSYFEAAADLGAGPWSRFRRVTVPLALPGALAAFFMVFIPTVGEYVTPLLVGGSAGGMYGNIVQDFFTKAVNWPLGSALAIVMLLLTLAMVSIALRLVDLRRLATA